MGRIMSKNNNKQLQEVSLSVNFVLNNLRLSLRQSPLKFIVLIFSCYKTKLEYWQSQVGPRWALCKFAGAVLKFY